MDDTEIKYFVEAALLAGGRPLSVDQLHALFDTKFAPEKAEIRQAISALNEEYVARGITVVEVASGFRVQIKSGMVERLQKLWEERPPRYSRALFETLALVAYRQPITRGEIEEIRGVSVSSNIVRSMLEREWIRVVGHRDVPGRPAMFGTTKSFLDYFGLKKLDDLPPLADLSDWETLRVQLNLPDVDADDNAADEGEVTRLPILYPEVAADAEVFKNLPDVEATFGDIETGYPIESSEDSAAFAKIVASPWPDPLATADEESGTEHDGNASVSRG